MDLSNSFIREFHRTDGTILHITQLELGDVGCVVWDAAIVLSYFIDEPYFQEHCGQEGLNGKYVLELGSGTGLVGIQTAINGANCTVTDLEELIPLINHNINSNKSAIRGHIQAKPLKWGGNVEDFFPYPDFIFLADCIYYDEGIEPLFQTLCQLCDGHTVTYFCHEIRLSQHKKTLEARFFKLIESQFFIEKIPMEYHNPDFRTDGIAEPKATQICNEVFQSNFNNTSHNNALLLQECPKFKAFNNNNSNVLLTSVPHLDDQDYALAAIFEYA